MVLRNPNPGASAWAIVLPDFPKVLISPETGPNKPSAVYVIAYTFTIRLHWF